MSTFSKEIHLGDIFVRAAFSGDQFWVDIDGNKDTGTANLKLSQEQMKQLGELIMHTYDVHDFKGDY